MEIMPSPESPSNRMVVVLAWFMICARILPVGPVSRPFPAGEMTDIASLSQPALRYIKQIKAPVRRTQGKLKGSDGKKELCVKGFTEPTIENFPMLKFAGDMKTKFFALMLVLLGAAAFAATDPTSHSLPCGGRVFVDMPQETTATAVQRRRVVVYALPNGNTIEQTRGRRVRPGMDWHFGIQHIGAQTRALRQLQSDVPTAVVYLEAGMRSWPAWRRALGEGATTCILTMMEDAAGVFGEGATNVELVAHSGGGSLIIGFINAVDEIPTTVTRIAFLDANYAYDSATSQAAKLARWLERDSRNVLVVAAYDDRRVEVDGKRIVSETGGTWGRTQAMVRDLRKEGIVTEETSGPLVWSAMGLAGRVDVQAHQNPENKILHTVIVERNGFLHALLAGGNDKEKDPGFFSDRIYDRWVE